MSRRLLAFLAAAACCPLAGCLALHATRPVDVVVTNADTGEPAAGVPVTAWRFHHQGMLRPIILNEAPAVSGTTDAAGRVTLPLTDTNHFHLHAGGTDPSVTGGADHWDVPDDVVRHGGHLDHPDGPNKYHVRLVARKPWLVQHLLPPYAPWYGTRIESRW